MKNMDILDTQIKGITGRIVIWLVSTACAIVISIMGTYYATKGQITELRSDIIIQNVKDKADQRLTDTIQNNRLTRLEIAKVK